MSAGPRGSSLRSGAPAHHYVHRYVDDLPFTRRHLRVWLLSAAGLFLGGYSFFTIGVVLPLLQKDPAFRVETWQVGAIAAAGIFGRLLGAVLFGAVADRYGRKLMYRIDPLILIVFGTATVLAPSANWMIAFQVLFGMGLGGDYPIAQAYVSETMPARLRSRLVAGVIANQALGGVAAASVGFLLLRRWPEIAEYHWILASVIPIAAIVFLFRLGIPESPKWLAERGRIAEAQAALKQLLGPGAELHIPATAPTRPAAQAAWSELFAPDMRKRTLLASVPWLCMDIAVYGIGIFTPMILLKLHSDGATALGRYAPFFAERLNAIEGSIYLDLFLVLGFALGIALMSRVTRIHMQIVGFLAMAAGLGLLALGAARNDELVFIVGGFVLFNTMINAGPNLTTYTLPSEIFPVRLRGSGHGLATAAGKTGATLGVLAFPIVQARVGLVVTLLGVAAMAGIGALVTYLCRVPPLASDIEDA